MDKKRVYKQAFFLILGVILSIFPVAAQAVAEAGLPQIIINIPSRTLELYQGEILLKEYPVAIGKPSTPTPVGEFTVFEKEVNPCWYPPGKQYVVPSGPDNPLGYRWLGIAPLYGIHGTNAPWSIGTAVSNGCVRMQEEDVEDLFERITCDTPVKIEYERVKVRVDDKGRATVGIYPDVYGRQKVTLLGVKQALAKAGLEGLAEEDFLQALIRKVPDQQVEFARIHKLKINGTLRPEYIITREGKKQIPVMTLADILNTTVSWDESKQTAARQDKVVPAKKLGNSVYIDIENLPNLFEGREVWNERENCLELTLPVAKFEGQIVSGDLWRMDSHRAMPALAVAKLLGERIKWQAATGELVVHGKPVSVAVIGEQPYISVADLGKVFNLAAEWDDTEQTLEMSYPLYAIDYSMYLDPGEEFF
ncbi:MAG: L,D-transpeptidase catalytic domain [Firmicutes bacterium]|nr:L,D-transpeptidase catalytic domain [Bacillota bacterium]